ncbi:MAG TPA: DUF1569 domain-containing protein [Thermoanaerobaculia bacterium]|nr:DUF1569 domain-containing protein [Thermoanaerobaculia bacterium]HQR66450.1 DUF1569 domain-containing protein [Thermoanaerobaculia bacterium]
MKNLFSTPDRTGILSRLDGLRPEAPRRWGKMDAAQMLAHCAAALEMATDAQPRKQKLIGVLLAPFVRGKLIGGEAPMMKNAPTDPAFVVADPRDFAREKARLSDGLGRFCDGGPTAAEGRVHPFFGRLTGAEWGVLMWKHLDHHFRQFGA